jgi:hypothetical protein
MKTFMATMAIGSLVATSAFAASVQRRHVDRDNMYHSYSQGSQSYGNPDRTYGDGNEPPGNG